VTNKRYQPAFESFKLKVILRKYVSIIPANDCTYLGLKKKAAGSLIVKSNHRDCGLILWCPPPLGSPKESLLSRVS